MVEALACGTPVIGMQRGAVPEIIEDGVTGASCGSVDDMIKASRIVNSYSRYSCRQAAEMKFSSDIIIKRYEHLYQKIISNSQK
jgi:glycosyltransferase involved in cell wall biosynthesis